MREAIEVRFKVYKDTEPDLFRQMKKHDEVSWSKVSKNGITEYCKERRL